MNGNILCPIISFDYDKQTIKIFYQSSIPGKEDHLFEINTNNIKNIVDIL